MRAYTATAALLLASWTSACGSGGSGGGPDGGSGAANGSGANQGTGANSGTGATGSGAQNGSGGGTTQPGDPTSWQNVHIGGGGYVTGLLYHPQESGLLYARTDVGGIFRWRSETESWQPLLDFLDRDSADHYGILAFAIDPTDPKKLYAAAGKHTDPAWAGKGAFLSSNDYGQTWTRTVLEGSVIGGAEGIWLGGNDFGRGVGERLQVDPNSPSTLYLGSTTGGLWRSGDSGASWQQVLGTGLTATSNINFVHIDASSSASGQPSQKIIVSTAAGLVVSQDGGQTWSSPSGQPANLMALRAAQAGEELYLTYAENNGPNNSQSLTGGVYSFHLGTLAFSNITPSTWAGGYGGVSVDPNDPEHIIVSSLFNWNQEDILESKNGGSSWTPLQVENSIDDSGYPHVQGSDIHWVTDVKFNPFDTSEFSFITGQGFYRCTGLGQTLDCGFDDRGLEELVPLQLVSPQSGAPLFSAMGDRDGYRHDDLTISPPKFSPHKGTTRSVALAEDEPEMLVRTYDVAPFGSYSVDSGDSWTDFPSYPSGSVGCVDYFCGLRNIALSADGTRIVWSPVNAAPSYSTDQGSTWHASTGINITLAKLPPKPVADRVNPNKFYAFDVMSGIVYRSVDGGVSFSASSTTLPYATADWYAGNFDFQTAYDHEGHIWVAAADGNEFGSSGGSGLYRSTDSGETFTQVAASQVSAVWHLGFGAARATGDYPTLFLWGIVGGELGLFRSTDEGASFERINDDAHQFGQIHQVIGDPKLFGRVYIAAEGRGILYATQD